MNESITVSERKPSRSSKIITGALILTAAGIITRVLGFVYRIYMSNIIGAEGMGLYQLIMPVYNLAWSISCSGFTTTVSKLTAQERAKGEYGNVNRILKLSTCITTSLGILLSVALFFSAEWLAIYFFKDPRTIMSLKILSLAFPFMAAGTCVRSFFIGQQENVVPAVNQVLEQCVRMIVIYYLAGLFIPMGLEYACAAAVIGAVCEEIFSLLYISISYRRYKSNNKAFKSARSHGRAVREAGERPSLSARQSLALILPMALPLTGNRIIGSLLSTFENNLIPQRLQLYGMTSSQAMSIYGQITGMAMPLIYFPTALLFALSTTLVPSVSENVATNNYARIRYTVSKSMVFASICGICAAGIFVIFAHELSNIIYHQPIGDMLLLLGIMCPFMYIQIIFSGVLNGLGFQGFIFRNSLLSSLINILFIYFLVPSKGINAFILGWFVSLIIICGLEINKIQKSTEIEIQFANWFLKPVLSIAASGLSMRLLANKFIFPIFGDLLGLIISLAGMGVMYVGFIFMTGCLSIEDLDGVFKSLKLKK